MTTKIITTKENKKIKRIVQFLYDLGFIFKGQFNFDRNRITRIAFFSTLIDKETHPPQVV